MAFSITTHSGSPPTTTFSVGFPYLRRDYVKVFVDDVELSRPAEWDFDGGGTNVVFVSAPPATAADNITIQRVTDKVNRVVDWTDGAGIPEADHDDADTQTLHVLQEQEDAFGSNLSAADAQAAAEAAQAAAEAARDEAEAIAAGVLALDNLSDVNAPAPNDGDSLSWDNGAGEWVPATPVAALDDLTDVNAPAPSDGEALVWDNGTSLWIPGSATGSPLNGYIFGCEVLPPGTGVSVAILAGSALFYDSGGNPAAIATLGSFLTKTFDDTTGPGWVEGDGNPGGATGQVPTSGWAHAFLLLHDDGVTIDGGYDINISGSNLLSEAAPSGYNRIRRVGSVYISGGNCPRYHANGTEWKYWQDPPLVLNGTTVADSTAVGGQLAPSGIFRLVQFNVYAEHSVPANIYFVPTTTLTDEAPSSSAAPLAHLQATSAGVFANIIVPFGTASTSLRVRTSATLDVLRIAALGFTDPRIV